MKTNLICLQCVRLGQEVSRIGNEQLSRMPGTPSFVMGQTALARAKAVLATHKAMPH